mgnify:CR=1 FL=1
MLEQIWPNSVNLIHDNDLFENLLRIGCIFHDFEYDIEFFVEIDFSTASLPNKSTLFFDLIEVKCCFFLYDLNKLRILEITSIKLLLH